MSAGDIFLLALGPLLALSAGLIIYGLGVASPGYRAALRAAAERDRKAGGRP